MNGGKSTNKTIFPETELANKYSKGHLQKRKIVYLKDYCIPDYLIDQTHLRIDLQEDVSVVNSSLRMRRNPEAESESPALILQGVDLELRKLAINGKVLSESDYVIDKESLTIHKVPESFTLDCETAIKPQENTSLVGLYQTKGLYCTHCEPEGFRKITYYLDRPDVMSEFTTTLVANKDRFPVLLSNGNLVDEGIVENLSNNNNQPDRHWVTWHDPFKKPSYLFAMVAGDLHSIEDSFTSQSGRKIMLRVFANINDLSKCQHALQTLKQAMRWDEDVYGREYDLDIFMIVAIADFNIGAMENKGLNIYRSDRLLMDPQTTSDEDIQTINEVVAHEYFHNWSGNRVTCRDWFQLSLKEGFTTYRGFQFGQNTYSQAATRIEEIQFIRTTQFAEDNSPLAHSIRPERYQAIWNFYTPTVYQKGAEVVRMLHTLLETDVYRKGADLFFESHDGQAVTTEDFVAAMESVSGRDLSQFRRWYSQTGTPRISIEGDYNPKRQQFSLTVTQCSTELLHIPLSVSLFGEQGPLHLYLQGQCASKPSPMLLELTERKQTFVFEQINQRPVPSLFRGFSAPLKWFYSYSQQDLILLIHQETDGVCRWEASQSLWIRVILQTMQAQTLSDSIELPAEIVELFRAILVQSNNETEMDQALTAKLFTMPSEEYLAQLAELQNPVDMTAIYKARDLTKRQLAIALRKEFEQVYGTYKPIAPISIDVKAMAGRALRNLALDYLVATNDPIWTGNAGLQLTTANNMTDTLCALRCLVDSSDASAKVTKQRALAAFYRRWKDQPLVINYWFEIQACCPLPGTLEVVTSLISHPAFNLKSPNQVRALIGSFCRDNAVHFHCHDGSGYAFLVDQIIKLNRVNPQIASRTLAGSPLINWRRYDSQRQMLIISQLQRLQHLPDLSNEVFEVVEKCLIPPEQFGLVRQYLNCESWFGVVNDKEN